MENVIITISRKFGSGGRFVGEQLARELGIPFYDKEIIQLAAEKSGLAADFIESAENNVTKSFLFSIATASTYSDIKYSLQFDTPITDKAFFAQATVIRELAEKSSCVVVGRCADYILRERDNLCRVFITAGDEFRLKNLIEKYDIPEKDAAAKMKSADKARSNFVRRYTGENWGDINNHDLIVNTEFTGIEGAVQVIKAALQSKGLI